MGIITGSIYAWFIIGFVLVVRNIYLFERKNDDRGLKFLVLTCPNRYKFTAGTAVFMIVAGYFGAMTLIPLFAVNYVFGWIQRSFVNRWIRTKRLGVPPGYRN
ncbi:hypothetical protein D3C85_128080 [compost metagenome]